MAEIIAALEAMFREKGEGRVEMPAKIGIHPRPDALIHAMPASIPAQNAAGIKLVAAYPENRKRGLPYVTGLLILNDPETGIPIALMDCTWLTAQRTGAATAVAAKYLARADSSTLGNPGLWRPGTEPSGSAEGFVSAEKSLRLRPAFRSRRCLCQRDEAAIRSGSCRRDHCERSRLLLSDMVVTAGNNSSQSARNHSTRLAGGGDVRFAG